MDGGIWCLIKTCVQVDPPTLDAQVQIQRLATKAFATFDEMT
jgi:hypothetical protein